MLSNLAFPSAIYGYIQCNFCKTDAIFIFFIVVYLCNKLSAMVMTYGVVLVTLYMYLIVFDL